MKVSVIIPSKGCKYLNYLLSSLREQVVKPDEMVLVVKDCDIIAVERACMDYSLPCIIIEQRKGYFTTALNIGRKASTGDIALFTDDDAIAPKRWIKRYIKAFSSVPGSIGCISSRDVYLRLDDFKIIPTKDDYLHTKLYRWFVRVWLEPPLEVLQKYRFGVYISKSLVPVNGPYLPERVCLSLPYRGVNMGFRGEVTDVIEFPEHPKLKRAPGNEQYAGLKLFLDGYDSLYIPTNPILHVHRGESLSRTENRRINKQICEEINLMRSFYLKLLLKNAY